MAFYYLQSKNQRIELHSKDGVWKFQALGVEWQFPESMERFVLYYLYGEKNTPQVIECFRLYDRSLSDKESQRIIDILRKSYKIEDYSWEWKDIVPYATEGHPLLLPNPFGYEVTLNNEEEGHLIELVKEESVIVIAWFAEMIDERHLISKKNGFLNEPEQLANSFYIQHGMNPFSK